MAQTSTSIWRGGEGREGLRHDHMEAEFRVRAEVAGGQEVEDVGGDAGSRDGVPGHTAARDEGAVEDQLLVKHCLGFL